MIKLLLQSLPTYLLLERFLFEILSVVMMILDHNLSILIILLLSWSEEYDFLLKWSRMTLCCFCRNHFLNISYLLTVRQTVRSFQPKCFTLSLFLCHGSTEAVSLKGLNCWSPRLGLHFSGCYNSDTGCMTRISSTCQVICISPSTYIQIHLFVVLSLYKNIYKSTYFNKKKKKKETLMQQYEVEHCCWKHIAV